MADAPGENVKKFLGPAQVLVGLVVSALLVVLLVRAVDLRALSEALNNADLRLVPIAVAPFFIGVWLRSVRWRLLLPGAAVTTRNLFRVQVIGFAINNLAPARAGDLARAVLLSGHGVGYGTTAASLVVERLLDGLTLALILLLALAFVPAPTYLVVLALIATFGFLALFGVVGLALWRSDALEAMAATVARRLPQKIGAPLQRLAGGFAYGLTPLRHWHRIPVLLGLSVLGWGAQFVLFYVLMLAFAMPGALGSAILAGAVGNFATLIPASPAAVGTFDGAVVKVVMDSGGVSTEQAAAYALVVHGTLFIPVIVMGIVMLWRSRLSLGQILSTRTA
ncbi:MAG: flippase-like domain-containing protein [Chloroflexi bacterium]|nr:flippase-like domain-containing protein [Chloroflexota bacterium]